MSTWTTKVNGDVADAADVNNLQTEKLDRDGSIPQTGPFPGFFADQLMAGKGAGFGAGLVHHPSNPVMPDAMEESFSLDGDRLDCWYRDTSDNKIYYTYSLDAMAETWATPTDISTGTDLNGMSFPYVFKVGGTYYMAGVVDKGGGDGNCLYLWSSTNKTTWAWAASGNALLKHSTTVTDWTYLLYNPAIVVIGSDWHLLIEGKTSTSNFQVGYSHSTLAAGPDFTANLSAAPVLAGYTGNPFLISVPDRAAILAVYGDCTSGTWVLRAASCPVASDPGLAASWTPTPGFGYQVAGVHIADPTIIFSGTAAKPWGMLLGYNYAQATGYHAYSGVTINEFYDLVTAPLTTASGRVHGVGVLEIDAIDLGHLGAARISTRDGHPYIPGLYGTAHYRAPSGNGLDVYIGAEAGAAAGDTNGGDLVFEAGMRYGGGGVAGDIEFWVGTGSTTNKKAIRVDGGTGNLIIGIPGTSGDFKGNVGINLETFGTNSDRVFGMGVAGHAPDNSPTNAFQMWAQDQAAGNTAPYFMTENGSVIALFKTVDARIYDAINSGDATTDGVIDAMRDALIALGFMAAS
jgi:hypothetical protein